MGVHQIFTPVYVASQWTDCQANQQTKENFLTWFKIWNEKYLKTLLFLVITERISKEKLKVQLVNEYFKSHSTW